MTAQTSPDTANKRELRKQKRLARLAEYELRRPRGDNRGWQITPSAGIPVWQLVEGGEYTRFVGRQ